MEDSFVHAFKSLTGPTTLFFQFYQTKINRKMKAPSENRPESLAKLFDHLLLLSVFGDVLHDLLHDFSEWLRANALFRVAQSTDDIRQNVVDCVA